MAKSLLEKLKDTTELKSKRTVFDDAYKLVGKRNYRNKNKPLSQKEYTKIFGFFPDEYFDTVENRDY